MTDYEVNTFVTPSTEHSSANFLSVRSGQSIFNILIYIKDSKRYGLHCIAIVTKWDSVYQGLMLLKSQGKTETVTRVKHAAGHFKWQIIDNIPQQFLRIEQNTAKITTNIFQYQNSILLNYHIEFICSRIFLELRFYKRHCGVVFWFGFPLLIAADKNDSIWYQADDHSKKYTQPEA